MKLHRIFLIGPLFLAGQFTLFAQAQSPSGATAAPRPTVRAEKLNLDQIQQKYLGNATNEIQVVQNRKYTKAKKLELGLLGGWVSADPFLGILAYGAYAAYHFSEMWGIRGLYWKDSSSPNADYYGVQSQSGIIPNTNAPSSLLGAEIQFTPMYGKVSLLGSSIIYYDLSLFAGAGQRKTQSGTATTPLFGLGQQFFFTKLFALGVDYRLMHYTETIIDQQPLSITYQKSTGTRQDWTHVLLLSLSCFL